MQSISIFMLLEPIAHCLVVCLREEILSALLPVHFHLLIISKIYTVIIFNLDILLTINIFKNKFSSSSSSFSINTCRLSSSCLGRLQWNILSQYAYSDILGWAQGYSYFRQSNCCHYKMEGLLTTFLVYPSYFTYEERRAHKVSDSFQSQ